MWERPGHFVVLQRVSEDGKAYQVLDPGGGNKTVTLEQVRDEGAGYWYIDREAW